MMFGKSLFRHEHIALPNMGWLRKLLKGSSRKISGDVLCGYENEDIDPSIELSIEDGKQLTDVETQLEEDEQLARAMQESLTVGSPRRYDNEYGNANMYLPIPIPYSTGFRICACCGYEIGHKHFLNCMGEIWHPQCFRCRACNLPIADFEFSMSGNYAYHKSCYKEHHHPRCDVCTHFIPTNAAGLIEYRAHPFWVQKYCPAHEHDGTPRCCSCERMKPRDAKYAKLEDGRKLCLECLDSAVMDSTECQPLYFAIQEFYEQLHMKVEQQVPLFLVERHALNEALGGEKSGQHHMPETRGLCLSEVQTLTTVLRRPTPRVRNGGRMDLQTETYKLPRRFEVTAILILFGLPRLLTGSILAHEMMHAWLRLKGAP